MMIRKRKRLWTLFLSAVLIVTQLPAVAMAENNAPEDGSIASFEELPSGVAAQTVPVGTELSGLNLPDTVTATVYHVTEDTVIPDKVNGGEADREGGLGREDDMEDKSISGNNAGDSSNMDSGEMVTTVTTSTGKISVTWDSEPAYDGDTADTYVFTADVGGYTLSSGAKLPQITVTVSADTAENPTEKPTVEPLPCALTEGCTLEEGHEGECVLAPPANDALVKTITDWTFVDDENLNAGELALPGVSMDNQADFDTVVSMLPKQIRGEMEGTENPETLDITGWSCEEYKQDGGDNWPLTGDYIFTAALPDGYACDPLPAVKVLLGGANLYANEGYDGLTITPTNGGSVSKTGDGQITLNANGDYKISGEWTGTLDGVDSSNRKAVITVPNGVTVNVELKDVIIKADAEYACAFAVAAGGTANITLSGINTLTSGWGRAGLEVPENTAVSIHGDGRLEANGGNSSAGIGGSTGGSGGTIEIKGGTVTANGGSHGAGIGGGYDGSGGTIAISGGTVTATGSDGAGIGGGSGSYGGTITISGGTVTATSTGGAGIGGGFSSNGYGGSGGTITISGGTVTATSYNSAGIGGGYGYGDTGGGSGTAGGDGGRFTINGNAVVFATSNQASPIGGGPGGGDGTKELIKGVVFEGSNGTVCGSPELPGDITIPYGSTLTVPDGATLTIPDNTALTNNGRIENHGTVNGTGTLVNNGTVNDHSGGTSAAVNGTGTVNKPSAVKITFRSSQSGQITQASYGDTITVQAEVSQKTTRLRTAAPNEVIFKIGSTVLGTESVTNKTATLTLPLTGDSWKPDSYTITAAYGGSKGLLPNDTGTAVLTVEKRGRTISLSGSPTVDGTSVTLTAAVLPEGSGDGAVQYGYAAVNDVLQAGSWQSGVAFTGLQPETKYYFFAKVAEGTFYQQAVSSGLGVTTGKAPANAVTGVTPDNSTYTSPLSVNQPQSSYTAAGDSISRSLSRSDLQTLTDSGRSLTLGCGKAGMAFDSAALKAILAAVPSTAGSITFAAAPADLSEFPDAAKQLGAHPVYDFSISYKDGSGNLITVPVNFPAGSAAITLNYTPAAGEAAGNLFMVYVDGRGTVTWLNKSSCHNGRVLAEVPHFSTYGVAYKTPAPVFTDSSGHWAKDEITFVAARGLLTGDSPGTGNNLFSPDGAMTRGMFVTALGRLAGINPDSYKTRSFTDVKADAYYAAYVEWAAQKNIVKGTGDKLFSPDAPVTREQMAVMMVNYAGQMGYSIPTPLASVTFADSNQISAWAAKEVAAMQRAGIVRGKDGNRFDPQGNATRAEGSAVLRRFIEVIIDPAAAAGWTKNDSGHLLYYQGGKAVTGWREISGKRYYFDESGIMAVNTKVDGYEVGPDGARR
ncbi:MAG: S-layer homology domain-containing protein [Eisenbergiella sp.]